MELREGFDYPLSRLDPFADHIDPPSVAVYETLVVKGPDGEPYPGLATDWSVSDDQLEWRFELRPGARFHSGDRCDARAVVEALEALRFGFHGGQQLWYWDPVDTVTAVSSEAFTIRLHFPYSRLPSLLWGTHTAIHNERRRAADPEGSGHDWADGTGPFAFRSWSDQEVIVDRWADYPGSSAAFLADVGPRGVETIRWVSILDPSGRVASLREGHVHAIHGPRYADIDLLEKDESIQIARFSQASNAYLALNWQRAELGFDEIHIRQALSMAIDRAAIVNEVLLGHGSPTVGPLSTDGEFYDPAVEDHLIYDPVRANHMLDEAGWTLGINGMRSKGGKPFAFECVIQDDAIHHGIGEGIKKHLARIGVELTIRPVLTFKEFYRACREGPDSFINKWLWQDPVDAALGFTSTRGLPDPNWQHASVPKLDEAYHKWLRASNPAELQAAASAIQHLVALNLPYIPILVPEDVWAHRTEVSDWSPSQSILYPFYHRTSVQDV